MIKDSIEGAEYIYSSQIKWGLKKFNCRVSFYEEEELSDVEFVICSILDTSDGGIFIKKGLGVMLGFSVIDNQPEQYYDQAESKLFEDILKLVEDNRLIRINGDYIELTMLGKISLQNNKRYRFFHGMQCLYENLSCINPDHLAHIMFPFYDDMGIYTELNKADAFWPEDNDIPSIIDRHHSQLIERIQLQSASRHHIYEAELEPYYDLETIKVCVNLYSKGGEYLPIVFNSVDIAAQATKLLGLKENALKRENVILECLFNKLWDDKSAVLTYNNLSPYFELVDFEELTKDFRTQWNDERLLGKITECANKNCWINISNNCDINVLYSHVKEFEDFLDWSIFTSRADDEFIYENLTLYPWDLENISCDDARESQFIERLIIKIGVCSDEWDWNALTKRLSEGFVLNNLSLVDVDLSAYTIDAPNVHQAILSNKSKRWDWNKVETQFSLSFILDNIGDISEHLGYVRLFDRVFADSIWTERYIRSEQFISAIKRNIEESGTLSSSLFNDKPYIWTDEVIATFSQLNLINWQSSHYSLGFECNECLVWNASFFAKYKSKITTTVGVDHVSAHIVDESILLTHQDFEWNWSNISSNSNISIDFIKSHHTLPWDWKILTERMYTYLNLSNIGHPFFIDRWNWSFLSKNIPCEFIENNLAKYANYWDWKIIIDRLLIGHKRLDLVWLQSIANILSGIADKTVYQSAWSLMTEKYAYNELKDLLKQTCGRANFCWDQSKLFECVDFDIFREIKECSIFIDWNTLSYSSALDTQLAYDPHSGIKKNSWEKDVEQLIFSYKDRWNYGGLSTLRSLNGRSWFLDKYAHNLDWEQVTLTSPLFAIKDKQKLSEYITKYKRLISFTALSERSDIDFGQVLKIAPDGLFDFNILIANGKFDVTIEDILKHHNYNWDWNLLSNIASLRLTDTFLIKYINKDWDWRALTKRDVNKLWSSARLLTMMASNEHISTQVDWYTITSRCYFPISADLLLLIKDKDVNWEAISRNDSIMLIIPRLADYLNWYEVSRNEHFPVNDLEILEEYADDLFWSTICARHDFVYTNEILERFSDRIDWSLASSANTIDFSTALVDRFAENWVWPILIKNKAFHNKIEFRDKGYFRQENIISFVNSFTSKPIAYHFTHMSNAVKIIRGQKIQSRNRAKGVFENSAGSNVDITAKAHNFARFYFISKSPTLFYNECLGKDKTDSNYYGKARDLGLPKCPMPVFFIVDVEEILSKFPDLCFYSNGNMQSQSTRCFQVVENPHHLNADGIYDRNNKNARQQEFLVQDELDISMLSSLEICCYDEYQCELLKSFVSLSPLKDRIVARPELYIRRNKVLQFSDTDDMLEVSTNYCDPFELRIEYDGINIPEIVNNGEVIREKGNSIYMKEHICIKKNKSFSVYFEVNEPRRGSWLIYRNK